ncbi:MAG: hypothetical protein AB7N65_30185 [Vicinamibacterales bacterium]
MGIPLVRWVVGLALLRRDGPFGVVPWMAIAASSTMCVVGWPDTRVGLAVNVALASAFVWAARS